MNVTSFISGKILFKEKIAIAAVFISFFVMVISLSISSGFHKEIRNNISKMAGDISIGGGENQIGGNDDPVIYSDELRSVLLSNPEVKSVEGVVFEGCIMRHGNNVHGVIVKAESDEYDSLSISVPRSLSKLMEIKRGDKVKMYFFVGDKIKYRRMKVASVFDDIPYSDDMMIVYAGRKDLQRVRSWKKDEFSSIEVRLKNNEQNNIIKVNEQIGTELLRNEKLDGYESLSAVSSVERFFQIFAWLQLVDRNVVIIIILMLSVASINMISGLLIILFRNVSTIGILKALGMSDLNIITVFMKTASTVVFKGMAYGNLLAVGVCIIQNKFGILTLNPENYFVNAVPADISLPTIALLDVFCYLFIMAVLFLPCLFVLKVDPAKTVSAK